MSLHKSFLTIGSLTFVSRMVGFVRDMAMAALLGAGPIADAFLVAFRLPNLFRSLFAEGAFNAAFVPMFTGLMTQEGKEKALNFAAKIFALMTFALLIFTLIMEIAMPLAMLLLAPGFAKDSEQFTLAVTLTRITFPYLLLISLTALLTGMLNSIHKFAAGAAAPILMNLCLIGSLLWLDKYFSTPAHGQAVGVLIAGFVQFFFLLTMCRKHQLWIYLCWPKLDAQVKKLLKLMGPGIIGSGVVQINLTISTMIATLIPGAVSYIYYADRLSQLPLAVIGTAVGTALLPMMSAKLKEGKVKEAVEVQNRALELCLFFTLPAAFALFILAHPLIVGLFERGEFGATESRATAAALMAYAAGLPAFVLIKLFTPTYFAEHDTKTPVQIAMIGVGVNIALNILLVFIFKAAGYWPHVGLALGTSISAWLNSLLLMRGLKRRERFALDAMARQRIMKILAACIGMTMGLAGLKTYLLLPVLVFISISVPVGIALFFAASFSLRIFTVQQLANSLKRKRK